LRYDFQYPQEVLQDIALGDYSKIKPGRTFCPTIVSDWVILNKNRESPYKFSVQRYIVSKEYLKRSKCEGNPPFKQKHYEVSFDETMRQDISMQQDISMITQSLTDTRLTINEESEFTLKKQLYNVELKINPEMTHMPHRAKELYHSDTNPMIVKGVMEMFSSTSK
jgi:hypothetical protein